jgi:hypothetical protein
MELRQTRKAPPAASHPERSAVESELPSEQRTESAPQKCPGGCSAVRRWEWLHVSICHSAAEGSPSPQFIRLPADRITEIKQFTPAAWAKANQSLTALAS